MIRIAIVDDEPECTRYLQDLLVRYQKEHGTELHISHFSNGIELIQTFSAKTEWDVVFLDIDMPVINGIETAREIRRIDAAVILVFLTNLAQYAIKGYEVDAMDYILKPISYYALSMKMKKIIRAVSLREAEYIAITKGDTFTRVAVNDIYFIEVNNRILSIHTHEKDFTMFGSLKMMEEKLLDLGFSRCNNCYLVNLRYVTEIRGDLVVVAGHSLPISRPRRKKFMMELTNYLGGKII